MSRGNNSSSTSSKDVRKLPEDMTEEVLDTPDLERLRAFDPRKEFDVMNRTVGARLDNERQAAYDDYGSYTGIPDAVTRNRLRDMRVQDANTAGSLAIAEGAQSANAAQGDYLSGLAALTAKRRRSGFTSGINTKPGNGALSAGITAGGGIAVAAIM